MFLHSVEPSAVNVETKQPPVTGNAMNPPASTSLLPRNHARSVSCGAIPTNRKRTESQSDVDESTNIIQQTYVYFVLRFPLNYSHIVFGKAVKWMK